MQSRTYKSILASFVSLTLGFGGTIGAFAQESAEPQLRPVYKSASVFELSPELTQMASITGILPILEQIHAQQEEFKSRSLSPSSTEYLAKRQKLLYLRQKLGQSLGTANLEVNAVRGQIEAEMAQLHELQATMVEKRARSLRRNTIINFVSGGVTKIVGYSIALGGTDTPTNILEIVDGVIQCTLMGVTLKELHDECHVVRRMPDVLNVLHTNKDPSGVYPQQIWAYLNEPNMAPSGDSAALSRKQFLVSEWDKRGIFARRDKAARLQTGSVKNNISLARITPQLLDDRMAMLSELRSVVSQMHLSLMKLSQVCGKTYDEDPSFEWPIASTGKETL